MMRPAKHWIASAVKAHVWPITDGRIETVTLDVLRALEAGGYVIVPREPTDAMVKATEIRCPGGNYLGAIENPEIAWQAMIDAVLTKDD